jgi:hypothetical protein
VGTRKNDLVGRALTAGLIFVIAVVQSFGVDHAVYVHVVDARSGRPVPGRTVEISWNIVHQRHRQTVRVQADQDGIAAFRLTEPVPAWLGVNVVKSGYWYPCSPDMYDSSEMLTTGISKEGGPFAAKFPNIADKFRPKPGEVFLFICHISFGEYLKEWFKGFK